MDIILEPIGVKVTKDKKGFLLQDIKTGEIIVSKRNTTKDLEILNKTKLVKEIKTGVYLLLGFDVKKCLEKHFLKKACYPYYIVGVYNQTKNSLYGVDSKALGYYLFDNILLIKKEDGYDLYLIAEDKFERDKITSLEFSNDFVEFYQDAKLVFLYDKTTNSFYEYTGLVDLFINRKKQTFVNHNNKNYEMRRFGKYNIRYHFEVVNGQKEVVRTDVFDDSLTFFKSFQGIIREYPKEFVHKYLRLPNDIDLPIYVVEGKLCVLDDIKMEDYSPKYPLKSFQHHRFSSLTSQMFPFKVIKNKTGTFFSLAYGEVPVLATSELELDYYLERLEGDREKIEEALKTTFDGSDYLQEKYPKLTKKKF